MHRPGKRHGNADALSKISDKELCKQGKRDTHVNWTEEKFTHIDELRKMYENRDDYKHDRECLDIGCLWNTGNYPNMDACQVMSTSEHDKKTKSKKVKNRPRPAKQRKQPIETPTIENIRKSQQEDDEISRILRLKENSDSVKPLISSLSHNSF